MRDVFPKAIKGKSVSLRRIAVSDAAAWKSINNAIAKQTIWPPVPSIVYARNELLHYDAMWNRAERYVYLILDAAGKPIGDFHLKSIDTKHRRAEFGHALHPHVWGTGITYVVLSAVSAVARKRRFTLWCEVAQSNIRSWKSLEKYAAAGKARFIGHRTSTLDGVKQRTRVYEL